MTEIIRPTPIEASDFMQKIGYDLKDSHIIGAFPSYFKDRRVVHITNPNSKSDRVLKFRPLDQYADREIENLHLLFSTYRFTGAHYPYLVVDNIATSNYVCLNMPYLGVDLHQLGIKLDMLELGYLDFDEADFYGIESKNIDLLVDQFRGSHLAFADRHGAFHEDLVQQSSPNNILYDPDLKRLVLIDAEAIAKFSPDQFEDLKCDFIERTEIIREWMHTNLTV